ncbi:hypothetical protein RclHR1_25120001 [Rhizophagus clarus]|uniref:Jacalin-type lectin domain-containing protein n=1 Tax=Rhizophagus clarus TaxID=94130 RepID=A0A2Z6QYY6_9GLOM|nr:hypothetical protein RclHR1_25120001 [Rhizophagus clarus]GET00560.1 hypothetical protein RCL_jg3453.t1 [Rhizophagus clarus]
MKLIFFLFLLTTLAAINSASESDAHVNVECTYTSCEFTVYIINGTFKGRFNSIGSGITQYWGKLNATSVVETKTATHFNFDLSFYDMRIDFRDRTERIVGELIASTSFVSPFIGKGTVYGEWM